MQPKYTTDSNILFHTVSHRRDLGNILDAHSIEIIKAQKETAKKLYSLEKGQKGSKEYLATFEKYEFLIRELNRNSLFDFIFIVPRQKKETTSEKYVPRKAKQKYNHRVVEFKGRKEITTEELLVANTRLVQRLTTFAPENLTEALNDLEKYNHVQSVLVARGIDYESYYHFNYNTRNKSKIILLLGGQCQDCGTQQNLTIHHIKPKRNGGNNNINNIKILCRECHDRVHGIAPKNGILMKIINESGIRVTA